MLAKKKKTMAGLLLKAPWWFSTALAVALLIFTTVFLDSMHVPGWGRDPLFSVLDKVMHSQGIRQLSAIFTVVLCIVAIRSFFDGRARSALLDRQNGMESIRNLSWQAFERLVAEAYERMGYHVQCNELMGADGGVDLILRKGGDTTLVQCKRWLSASVGAPVVREMFGLMTHHGAKRVKIVCVGKFTKDAEAFASGKPIELVSGQDLVRLVRSVQSANAVRPMPDSGGPHPEMAAVSAQQVCPKCGAAMVKRKARKTQEEFFGCSTFPRCNGIRH
jgi:restriction system protein